ncbi:hypothetical protein VTL71DRAFT_9397 [Oculimacula yallundae]|uniref:Uncharacterized protein n=1 Tax=Oculimacula yallundae TaxID=86028 RepID=A0ABR4BSZ1_9HELO
MAWTFTPVYARLWHEVYKGQPMESHWGYTPEMQQFCNRCCIAEQEIAKEQPDAPIEWQKYYAGKRLWYTMLGNGSDSADPPFPDNQPQRVADKQDIGEGSHGNEAHGCSEVLSGGQGVDGRQDGDTEDNPEEENSSGQRAEEEDNSEVVSKAGGSNGEQEQDDKDAKAGPKAASDGGQSSSGTGSKALSVLSNPQDPRPQVQSNEYRTDTPSCNESTSLGEETDQQFSDMQHSDNVSEISSAGGASIDSSSSTPTVVPAEHEVHQSDDGSVISLIGGASIASSSSISTVALAGHRHPDNAFAKSSSLSAGTKCELMDYNRSEQTSSSTSQENLQQQRLLSIGQDNNLDAQSGSQSSSSTTDVKYLQQISASTTDQKTSGPNNQKTSQTPVLFAGSRNFKITAALAARRKTKANHQLVQDLSTPNTQPASVIQASAQAANTEPASAFAESSNGGHRFNPAPHHVEIVGWIQQAFWYPTLPKVIPQYYVPSKRDNENHLPEGARIALFPSALKVFYGVDGEYLDEFAMFSKGVIKLLFVEAPGGPSSGYPFIFWTDLYGKGNPGNPIAVAFRAYLQGFLDWLSIIQGTPPPLPILLSRWTRENYPPEFLVKHVNEEYLEGLKMYVRSNPPSKLPTIWSTTSEPNIQYQFGDDLDDSDLTEYQKLALEEYLAVQANGNVEEEDVSQQMEKNTNRRFAKPIGKRNKGPVYSAINWDALRREINRWLETDTGKRERDGEATFQPGW